MNVKLVIAASVWAALHWCGAGQRGVRPDPRLTPGVAGGVTVSDICTNGYAKRVRDVPISVKHEAMAEYGIVPGPGERFEIDHLVPLELGGTNDLRNLWPQPFAGAWTAGEKDRLENALHRAVCAGREPLGTAQQEIRTDWIGAYTRRFGAPGGTGNAD